MRIFIPESFVFWYEVPNLINNYVPDLVMSQISPVEIFDNGFYNYSETYQTIVMNYQKWRYTSGRSWMRLELKKEYGKSVLRYYLFERRYIIGKRIFTNRYLDYLGLKGMYNYYNLRFITFHNLFTYPFMDYNREYLILKSWLFQDFHSKDWRMWQKNIVGNFVYIRKWHEYPISQFARSYSMWTRNYPYFVISNSMHYWISLHNLFLYSWHGENLFMAKYQFPFMDKMYSSSVFIYTFYFSSVFLSMFHIFSYINDIINYIYIFINYCLFFDFVYLVFFINSSMVILVLRFYSLFLGFYEPLRITVGFLRIWKNTLFSINFKEFVNYKKQRVGYYAYIRNRKPREEYLYDDLYFYPVFMIDLLENKYRYFMRIEWLIGKLMFIFNIKFFDKLLKQEDIRAFDCFLNLFLFILFFMPLYTLVKIIVNFIYYIRYIYMLLVRDSLYHYTRLIEITKSFNDLHDKEDDYFEVFKVEQLDFFFFWRRLGMRFHSIFFFDKRKNTLMDEYLREMDLLRDANLPQDAVIEAYTEKMLAYEIWKNFWSMAKKPNFAYIAGKLRGFRTVWGSLSLDTGPYIEDDSIISLIGHPLAIPSRLNAFFNYIFFAQRFFIKYINLSFKIFFLCSSFFAYYFYYWFFYTHYIIFLWWHALGDFLLYLMETDRVILRFRFVMLLLVAKKVLLSFVILHFFWTIIVSIFVVLIDVIKVIFNFIIKLSNISIIAHRVNLRMRIALFFFYFFKYNVGMKILSVIFFRMWIVLLFSGIIFCYIDIIAVHGWLVKLIEIVQVQGFDWFLRFFFDIDYSSLNAIHIMFYENFYLYYIFYWEKYCMFFNWSNFDMFWYRYLESWYANYIYYGADWWIVKLMIHIAESYGFDFRWYAFQVKLIYDLDFGFAAMERRMLVFEWPSWYTFVMRTYDVILIYYIYFLIEWVVNYGPTFLLYYSKFYLSYIYMDWIFVNFVNYISYFFYLLYYFFCFYVLNEYRLFFIDMLDYVPFRFWWFFSDYAYLLVKYRFAWHVLFYDFMLYLQYLSMYYYYYLFYNSYSFITFCLKILFFYRDIMPVNWNKYTYGVVESFRIFDYYVASPLAIISSKAFSMFKGMTYNHFYGYGQHISPLQIFPSPILREYPYVGTYSIVKYFIHALATEDNVYTYFFNQFKSHKFGHEYTLRMTVIMYFYCCIIIVSLMVFLTYVFKIFRDIRGKEGMFISGANMWYKINTDNINMFTTRESEWVYSLDFIYSFDRYQNDLFRGDPFLRTGEIDDLPYVYLYKFFMQAYTNNKEAQNDNNIGWKYLGVFEDYYEERYQSIVNIIDGMLKSGLTSISDQLYYIHSYFDFLPYYTRSDLAKDKMYTPNFLESRLQDMKFYADYKQWLFEFIMPFMMRYCDDPVFIKNSVSKLNDKMWRYLFKFRTVINEKEKFQIEFIEFFFTEPDFYDFFFEEFGDEEHSPLIGPFVYHFMYNWPYFTPFSETLSINRGTKYRHYYAMEDYMSWLSKVDDKYFGNLVNFSFGNTIQWPKYMRTRIGMGDLKKLFNVKDDNANQVEATLFLPFFGKNFVQGDLETDLELQARVNAYWETTLTKENDFYNRIGYQTTSFQLLMPQAYMVYVPCFAIWFHFPEVIADSGNDVDLASVLYSAIVVMLSKLDLWFFVEWGIPTDGLGDYPHGISMAMKDDLYMDIYCQGTSGVFWNMYFKLVPWQSHYAKVLYNIHYGAMYPFSDIIMGVEDQNILIKSTLRKSVNYYTPLGLIPGLEIEDLARLIKRDGIFSAFYGEIKYFFGLLYSIFWGKLPVFLYFFILLFLCILFNYLINTLVVRYDSENLFNLQGVNKKILYDLFSKKQD